MAHVAFILSGCGVFDGSEIHESVLCLLALAQAGHTWQCFAPDTELVVVNHLTNQETSEKRNILIESARIARGDILPLAGLKPANFDAVLLPGGFGAAKNLSTYATEAESCRVNPDLERILRDFHTAKKPIAATCITPAVIAKVFQGTRLKLTLGQGPANDSLEKMGHEAIPTGSPDIAVDEANRIYTTPCYMGPPNLATMFEGVKKLVAKL